MSARRPTVPTRAALVLAFAASVAAAVGWARTPARDPVRAPSIAIVDVRPLQTDDPNLRDLITHTFAVRVSITGWRLLPYLPGAGAADNRRDAGHWRLYIDGHSLGESYGSDSVSYTRYLRPGTHWVAAELTNADSTSLRAPVWSEPVVLQVPRVIRCWQSGWRGPSTRRTPTFRCAHAESRRGSASNEATR